MAHRELSIHCGLVKIQAIFCKLGSGKLAVALSTSQTGNNIQQHPTAAHLDGGGEGGLKPPLGMGTPTPPNPTVHPTRPPHVPHLTAGTWKGGGVPMQVGDRPGGIPGLVGQVYGGGKARGGYLQKWDGQDAKWLFLKSPGNRPVGLVRRFTMFSRASPC